MKNIMRRKNSGMASSKTAAGSNLATHSSQDLGHEIEVGQQQQQAGIERPSVVSSITGSIAGANGMPRKANSAYEEHGGSHHDSAIPPALTPTSMAKPPAGSTEAFVQRLTQDLPFRQGMARLVSENCLVGSGDEQVALWLRDEGYNQPLQELFDALSLARTNDLLFWASCYSLHVQWSPDGSHPWDLEAEAAGSKAAMLLEIGRAARGGQKAVILLDDTPLTGWSFQNGLLRTTTPVNWRNPDGMVFPVHLQLTFSSTFSTAPEGEIAPVAANGTDALANGHADNESAGSKYVGVQVAGIMWPASDALSEQDWAVDNISSSPTPTQWPLMPVIVAGKVNITSKQAAMAAGYADSLRSFAGSYSTTFLRSGNQAPVKGPELIIQESAGRYSSQELPAKGAKGTASKGSKTPAELKQVRPTMLIRLDEHVISNWHFDTNNVLCWEGNPAAGSEWTAGWSGWLQFIYVPGTGGESMLIGNVFKAADPVPEGYNIYGESKGSASKLLPNGTVSTFLGANAAGTVDTAAVLLMSGLMAGAKQCWRLLHEGAGKQELSSGLVASLDQGFRRLQHINILAERYRLLFKSTDGSSNGMLLEAGGDTTATDQALRGAAEAASSAQAARTGLEGAEQSLSATRAAEAACNAVQAVAEASNTAWRARQTATAEAAAEQQALATAEAAQRARSIKAYGAQMAAAQSYNQAKQAAIDATAYVLTAAGTAMRAVEAEVKHFSGAKDWRKLMHVAAASHVAEQTVLAAEEAQAGWAQDTLPARRAAVDAAQRCSELSKACLKQMKAIDTATGAGGMDIAWQAADSASGDMRSDAALLPPPSPSTL